MSGKIGLAGLALALVAGSAAAQGEPPNLAFALHLRCLGVVSYDTAPITVDNALLVDIEGDRGRIRMPRVLRQPGGGDVGWRPLHEIKMDEHLITGHFAVSPWNWPSVVIDRVSGHLDLVGFRGYAFHGDCGAYDPNDDRRF
jgi:hypothetical protein